MYVHIYVQCVSLIKLFYAMFLQEELERLLKAAEDGNVSDLYYLIDTKKYNVDTRGPSGDPVS